MKSPPLIPPASSPCGSCPYRRDVASGIWAKEEYRKLPKYDRETGLQPTAVFLCHQQNGRVCAGWCGTHDMSETLAVRFASFSNSPETIDAILDYRTSTPLFSSGREACKHGMREIAAPSGRAQRTMAALILKRKERNESSRS